MIGDVLDLVGERAGVRLPEVRQRLGERLARDVEAEHARRKPRLQLGRQLRNQTQRLERRVTGRLGAERIEVRSEVTVHAERLDERHRSRDAADELVVDGRRCRRLGDRGMSVFRVAVRSVAERLEQPLQSGIRGEKVVGRAFEQRAPLARDRLRVLEVVLEQDGRVAGVEPVDVHHAVVAMRRRAPRSSRPSTRAAS